MDSHCPGCGSPVDLAILIVANNAWRCAGQCISFAHQHLMPEHHVEPIMDSHMRDDQNAMVAVQIKKRCSWSGSLVVLTGDPVVTRG